MPDLIEPKRVVNELLFHLVRSPEHRYVLEGEFAHPLLVEQLRELAAMSEFDTRGTIALKVQGVVWQVLVSVTPGEEVTLNAESDTL